MNGNIDGARWCVHDEWYYPKPEHLWFNVFFIFKWIISNDLMNFMFVWVNVCACVYVREKVLNFQAYAHMLLCFWMKPHEFDSRHGWQLNGVNAYRKDDCQGCSIENWIRFIQYWNHLEVIVHLFNQRYINANAIIFLDSLFFIKLMLSNIVVVIFKVIWFDITLHMHLKYF